MFGHSFLAAALAVPLLIPQTPLQNPALETPQAAAPAGPERVRRVDGLSRPDRVLFIELKINACRNDACRTASMLYDAYHLSLMTCMIAGQREVAAWQNRNPGWRVTRWSCGFAPTTGEGSA